MRALVVEKLGDPTAALGAGVLRLDASHPEPPLPAGHLLVAVAAASVNFPDALQVKGEYQEKRAVPFIPGNEIAGTVLRVGDGVTRFKDGDKVCAILSGGAFAERAVVHQAAAWRLPQGLDLACASAVPVVYGTADLALRHRAGLTAGQTVLVLGAAGGVGLAAVQIAKVLGARVVAVATGPQKTSFLKDQGADAVIDAAQASPSQPLHKLIKAAAPKGVDVVFDPVGGSFFPEALKTVAWGAHYLIIGFAAGGIPKIAANLLLVKNVTAHGVFWGSYLQNRPEVLSSGMRQVLAWLAEGKLRVHVSHRFPLEQAPEAFRTILERRALGKVVLTVGAASPRL